MGMRTYRGEMSHRFCAVLQKQKQKIDKKILMTIQIHLLCCIS